MSEKYNIVIADDDDDIREVLILMLEKEGYGVTAASSGRQATASVSEKTDLVILDVMMPGLDGFGACRLIREKTDAPVLFLTAKTDISDRETAYRAGGDDYLVKPFSQLELLLKIKSMLRRYTSYNTAPQNQNCEVITVSDLTIDTATQTVTRAGVPVVLTGIEYGIIELLAKNRSRCFSTREIYEKVWNEKYISASTNTVMVHMRNLRTKLGDSKIIKTAWGKGYVIER